MNKKIKYIVLFFLVIILGLLSRQMWYPSFLGDIFYWVMLYFLFRILFTRKKKYHAFYLAIIAWIFVEIIHLINFGDFYFLKNNMVFHLIFWYWFSIRDILLYVVGIVPAYFIDKKIL